ERSDVHRGGVPLQVRVRRDDALRDVIAVDALQELLDAEILRADAVERADRAAEDVVPALVEGRLLDRGRVLRLLDDAQDRPTPALVAADPAEVTLGDVPALATEGDAILRLDDRRREPLGVLRR